MKARSKRWIRRTGIVVVSLALIVLGLLWLVSEPRPEGETGAEADRFAQKIQASVGIEDWNDIKLVAFEFGGRNQHVWDRQRGLAQVVWGDTKTKFSLGDQKGRAWREGKELNGQARDEAIQSAFAHHINDTYWLNPVAKFFEGGAQRSLVRSAECDPCLLISYESGGVTPGDAYLWHVDKSLRPTRWQMWVSIIPIGGISSSWNGWQKVTAGAQVATRHQLGPIELKLANIKGAQDWAELGMNDPFTDIL